MVLETLKKLCITTRCYGKTFFAPKNGKMGKWAKNGQKLGVLNLKKKLLLIFTIFILYWKFLFLFGKNVVLHEVRYPWKLQLNRVIFIGFGQACLGMPNVLQNNKLPIALGKVELFCLFVGCSYTSWEATVLSCCFIWVCFSMPKVLWNNKSPISLEMVEWFCWFFACSYLHLVGYSFKLLKFAILGWHYQA